MTARIGHARLPLATRPATAARPTAAQAVCSASLLLAAGIHVAVGVEHAGSAFGTLAFAAGFAQSVLGAAVLLRPTRPALGGAMLLGLVLIQLYLINVTVGLPPAIAHSHIGGTHQFLGFTLAWPGVVDAEGVIAKIAELIGVIAAARVRAA